ncbi:hypothetical protein IU397_11300 [Actibacterium sp. 188UL27-1]|nr:hypothetical protein [Actibacterium sp. 188UL27-1]
MADRQGSWGERLRRAAGLWVLVTCLTLPSMFAVLAEIVPGVQSYVICAGDRLITVKVGPDGEPVDAPETTFTHCVMGDVVVLTKAVAPDWTLLARSYARPFSLKLHQAPDQERLAGQRFSRGPPRRA